MGTNVELLLECVGEANALQAFREAEQEIARLEKVFSRFDASSELSRLNDSGSLVCSAELFEVVQLSMAARRDTAGRFDPTVHEALVAAGYHTSFEKLNGQAHQRGPTPTPSSVAEPVKLDHATRRVTLSPNIKLDLGGIAKGWIVDQVLELITSYGPALVNAGGDIAASQGATEPWTIRVPDWDQDDRALTFDWGAIATSGTDRRRWSVENGSNTETRHHVIDPRTGTSATTDIQRATVFAATCAEAEVGATRLLLAGTAQRAMLEANHLGIAAVLIGRDGNATTAGALA
jgi:thiamine biosynthesis lipoprotein